MALFADGQPVYRVHILSAFNHYEILDFYNAEDNILSLPYIEQQEHMLLTSEISKRERDLYSYLALRRYLSRSFS